ncbi:MAG: efflux transporter outer membrane subunit [Thermodesulfobacteriota bacterium]
MKFSGIKTASNRRPRVERVWNGRKANAFITATALMAILNGCMQVGPDYTRMEPELPPQWRTEMAGGLSASATRPATLAGWWTTLNDPALNALMAEAVSGSLDIRVALARIREARALRGISRADLFPTLDASASAIKSRSSQNSGAGRESELYSAGFDAGWELDVFGGLRRSVEAAQADLEAVHEELHAAMVSLMAEVALNYVELRTFQSRLAVTEANIKTQQETHDLNRSLYQAGMTNELVVQQSLRILESSRSQIPTLESGVSAAKNRLAVLLGKQPGELHGQLDGHRPLPVLPGILSVGIPAETMRQRPDIRKAERNLAAQTARIGVATADLYPRFRLMGSFGLESLNGEDFLQWDSHTWSLGPGVSWKIFNGGAVRQHIELWTARQEQALIQYQETVLLALEEVETALTAYAKEQARRDAVSKAAVAGQRAVMLAKEQYRAGLVDFNSVLDAERSLLILEDELAQSNGVVISNMVRLYKALGGGWTNHPAEMEGNG